MMQSWGEHARAVAGGVSTEGEQTFSRQLRMYAAHQSDAGHTRPRNEDYTWIDQQAHIYIVADGLGARAAGHVASRLAATTVGEHLTAHLETLAQSPSTIKTLLTEALEMASRRVRAAARMANRWRGMGTTLIVALVHGGVASICHAGDARAYLVREGRLLRLTEDDSAVMTLLADGAIDEAEARAHPQRHFVTKMLGQDELVQPTFTEVTLAPGDWLLLCSDGLWGQVGDDSVLTVLHQAAGDPARAVEALVQAANDAGGEDNVSVVLMRVDMETVTRT